jgi:hypothetical protein
MPQADKDFIASAIEFWRTLYDEGEATVKFTKKDGVVRIMKCTLDFTKIPKNKHPKKVDMSKILKLMQESGIIHIYDLEKKDWRSVPFQQVDWMETPTKRYKIRPHMGKKAK